MVGFIANVWSILPIWNQMDPEHAWYKCTTYFGILGGVPNSCHPCCGRNPAPLGRWSTSQYNVGKTMA